MRLRMFLKSKEKTIRLFHAGHYVIREPDIHMGRINADFGQGFYLSDNEEFSKRWSRERKGLPTYLNKYALDPEDLKIKRFARDGEWFDYIFSNRSNHADAFAGFDVIIGPIANDTLYDTFGIVTSGLLENGEALRLLRIGPVYMQTVIKTEKAVRCLRFLSAEEIGIGEIAAYRNKVRAEQERYLKRVAKELEKRAECNDR